MDNRVVSSFFGSVSELLLRGPLYYEMFFLVQIE